MFEENEVLTQIKGLRQEVGSRLDNMEQRLEKIEAEFASAAKPPQEFDSRLEEMDRRLQWVETRVAASPAPAPAAPHGIVENGSFIPEPQVEHVPQAPQVPTHRVEIMISPLNDVAHVNVVEAALRAIVGVEAVTLQSLKGAGAEVAVEVQDGVSLIGGLRRTLPVAFDVSEADTSSFTLGLVQPPLDAKGNVVAQRTL